MRRKLLIAIVIMGGLAVVTASAMAVQRIRTTGSLRLMARG